MESSDNGPTAALEVESALDAVAPGRSESDRDRIREIAADMRNNDDSAEGVRDMQKMMMAAGSVVPLVLFDVLVSASSASSNRKKTWVRRLKQCVPKYGVGGFDISYVSRGGQRRRAKLVLDRCAPDHDLSAQLDPVFSVASDQKKDELRKHMGMLILCGRQMYGRCYDQSAPLLKKIQACVAGVDVTDAVQVDYENTTLYLSGLESGDRVGIFIRDLDQ